MTTKAMRLGIALSIAIGVMPTAAAGQEQEAVEAPDSSRVVVPEVTAREAEAPPAPAAVLNVDPPALGTTEKAMDVDAWGARRSVGLAVGEVALINAVVWGYNEFIRGGNFTQVNPRTWYTNISDGFFFDDNHFSNNMFAHPYHGSLYYSAARSNGLNYWESVPFSLAGSFFWECCGEAHPMAWNDWIATGVGGAAIGEVLYRATSTILDNEATGSERFWREFSSFLIDPLRGFNRLVSGRSGKVHPNPTSPYDRHPPHLENLLKVGFRHLESTVELGDEEFTDDYSTPFVEFDMFFGNPFTDTRRKPFDQFRMNLIINLHDKKAIGGFNVVGNLYSSDIRKSDKVHHVFTITQNFDYTNNNAIEFGGQSVGAGILSDWKLSEESSIRTDINLHGYLLNAVDSEYAFAAEIPDRERLREYDMGTGVGGWLRAGYQRDGHQWFGLGYRLAWIHTLNGSNINGGDTSHLLHAAHAQAAVPLFGRWGIGGDALGYLRDSNFDDIGFNDVEERVGRIRLYGWFRTS